MSDLIEGLPDAVALLCLAYVPFVHHLKLQLVCRSWRDALRSPELLKARHEVGVAEEFLCVSAFEPENLWQLYDPRLDIWMTLPTLPSEIKHLSNFGAVKLFVLGGNSDSVDPQTGDHDSIFPTNEVWSYNPILRQWTSCARMLVARAMFACSVLDGRIVVAGGLTGCRKPTTSAEIYDPEKDKWDAIAELGHTCNSACTGMVISGKFYVLHKGLSMVQVLEHRENRWLVEDEEWLQGPSAMVGGDLYVLHGGLIIRPVKPLMLVISIAFDFQSRIGFALIGQGQSLYLIGGVDGPGQWNVPIKLLSDVNVLNVKIRGSTWRQVSPMTRCHGTVVGSTLLTI
ncbi:F-box/kelch-repeat protein [Nymphaea thermarum]|nr:F-box/kelch-repeat protein [Nymphaea thermarum]